MARILIVEDNPFNLKLVVLLLENAGLDVMHAHDAQTAINLARIYRPDLVLMDIRLPGMDGLSATQLLKNDETTRRSKIYALTAFAMKADEEKIMAAGCDGYIVKPIRYREFLETVAAALTPTPE